MVNRLITAVTKQPDPARAWRSLVAPTDKVGIKISAAGGQIFTTHRDVVEAIAQGLSAAGVSRNNITVWDRSVEGARAAGYTGQLFRLIDIPPRVGYDPKVSVSAPILGRLIWGDLDYIATSGAPLSGEENTSNLSHVSRVLTQEVTKIINVPVMSQSETNAIAGCIYNMTVPNLDNWRRFTQATPFGASSIAEIYNDPLISKKVVLNIMDGLIAEYAGGPDAHPNFQRHHATIYASFDPVAIDTLALRQIEQWRAQASLPPMGDRASYLEAAVQIGLGQAAPAGVAIHEVSP